MSVHPDDREPLKAINANSVKHRSPFRYPGGKTWLIEQIGHWLDERGGKNIELVEPFAGGAIVSLTAVAEGWVGRATLVERDEEVRDVWRTILGRSGRKLAEQIRTFDFTPEKIDQVLSSNEGYIRDRAFRTILKNRINRNGIIAQSGGRLNNGEDGAGLSSRWYPETLSARILDIVDMKDHIEISSRKMGLGYMAQREEDEDVVFFIDPPYPQKGRRLYSHSDVDPAAVFENAARVRGDFLLTYRSTEEIRNLLDEFEFEARRIAMQNGHNSEKTELLIGRDLSWTKG
jgi:DNA adenine methylase